MKKKSSRLLLTISMALLGSLFLSMTAFAAEVKGALTSVTDSQITGWACDLGCDDETVPVELRIYEDGSTDAAKVVTVQADREIGKETGNATGVGKHGFDYPIDLAKLGGTSYQVEAYAVIKDAKMLLSPPMEYTVPSVKATEQNTEKPAEEIGPGIPKKVDPPKQEEPKESKTTPSGYKKGKSLGIFRTTAYCPCKKCSGKSGLTYSGTVPQANHTISADTSVLPIGTKVMIGDTVYTVEDIGGGVKGNTIDIFFNTHQEALNYGVQNQEVFSVEEE